MAGREDIQLEYDYDTSVETEHTNRVNGLTLVVWSIINVLLDIYDSDEYMPAVGDIETNDPKDNQYNHMKLKLISHFNLFTRYRENPVDENIRGILLPNVLLPSIRAFGRYGKIAIPEETYSDPTRIVDREHTELLGDALMDAPYAFQILKSWFLPSTITYNTVPLRFMIPLLNDMLVDIWYILLYPSHSDSLVNEGLFTDIVRKRDKIRATSFIDVANHSIKTQDFTDIYNIINGCKKIIASAACEFMLAICSKLMISPFVPRVHTDIMFLRTLKE